MFTYPQNGYTNSCYCYDLAQALTKILDFEVRGYSVEYKLAEGLKINLHPRIDAFDYNNKLKKIQSLMESTGIYTEVDPKEIYVIIPDNMRDTVLLLLQLKKSNN